MTARMIFAIVLIIASGVFVAWQGVELIGTIYGAGGDVPALEDDAKLEKLVQNAERATRILPLLSGGGALLVGVVLALHEAVRMRNRRTFD